MSALSSGAGDPCGRRVPVPQWLRFLRRIHGSILLPTLDFLLPADCFACGEPLGANQHLGACSVCWAGLAPLKPPVCRACGLPLPAGTDLLGPAGGRCAACVLHPGSVDAVQAAVAYDGLARRFLLRAKSGGRREILGVLGLHLGRSLELSRFSLGCTIVVPVPSHPWTLLRRGFNPALELARPLARLLALPLRPRLLARRITRGTASKGLRLRDRRGAVSSSFLARPMPARGRVLLIDDVVTTGATVEACAEALRARGAVEVRVAAWARTLRRDGDMKGGRRIL